MSIEWAVLPATVDLLGECPTWDGATQTLYWTDIPGKALKSWHPQSGLHRVWPMPEEVGSFALRQRGGAVLALRSGFALFDFTTRELTMLPSPEYEPGDDALQRRPLRSRRTLLRGHDVRAARPRRRPAVPAGHRPDVERSPCAAR